MRDESSGKLADDGPEPGPPRPPSRDHDARPGPAQASSDSESKSPAPAGLFRERASKKHAFAIARMRRASPPPRSLYPQFARLLILATSLPSLVFGAAMIWQQNRGNQQVVSSQAATVAATLTHELDESILAQLASLHVLAGAGERHDLDWGLELSGLQQRYPSMRTLIATDERGAIVGGAPVQRASRAIGNSVADRDYFRLPARTGRDYISNAFVGRGIGTDPLVVLSVPWHRAGRFAGVVEASLDPARLYDEAGHGDYQTVLLDREGRVIHATAAMGLRFLQRAADSHFAAALAPHTDTAVRGGLAAMPNGDAAIVAHSPTSGGWDLYVVVPEAQVRQGIRSQALFMAELLLLAVLGAVLVFSWYARLLGAASSVLLLRLRSLASGRVPADLARREREHMPEELAPVFEAIVELSLQLNHAHDELRQTLARREDEVAQRTAQLREALRELDRLARTDPLTGALNRRGRDEFLQTLAQTAAAVSSIGVLLLDVDHFKAYNDRYGHRAGDNALRSMVDAIRAHIRADTDAVVRTGGEEFCVLLPGAGAARASQVASRIIQQLIQQGIEHRDSELGRLTCSVGIAVAYHPTRMDEAMDTADQALYRAKRRGRNRCCN